MTTSRSRSTSAIGTEFFLAPVLVLLLLTGCTAHADSPAPSTRPSTTPVPSSPAALTETFVSHVNGYQMSYPEDWTVVAATKPTRANKPDTDASVDKFQSPQTRAIYVKSEPIPTGETEDEWVADFLPGPDAEMPQCFPPRQEWIPITVDGNKGGLLGGDFGCSFTQAVVFAGGRAYIFDAMPDPAHVNTDIFDQGLFDQMLASVRLTPQTAT